MPAPIQVRLNFACLKAQLKRGQFRKAWFHVQGLARGVAGCVRDFLTVDGYLWMDR